MRNGVTTNIAETFSATEAQRGRHPPSRQQQASARYLAELDYCFSTRKLSDSARMNDLRSRTAGRRLSYLPVRDLTGRWLSKGPIGG